MAKYLISFVGTGQATPKSDTFERQYRTARYSFNGVVSESSFVSSVLYDALQIDAMILVGTAKSMWEEVYRYFCERNGHTIDVDYYLQLADTVEKADHKTDTNKFSISQVAQAISTESRAVVIPYGLNRDEHIEIFRRLAEAMAVVQARDLVYLDITHSFRSLPLFANAALGYLKEVKGKDFQFAGVYYGMLDAIREFDNIAPIIDLSATLELSQWTTAAHSFIEYGKGYLLADLLEGDEAKTIRMFSDAVGINFLSEIKQKLTNFQRFANSDLPNEFAKWVIPSVLESFIKPLQQAGVFNYLFQYHLSVWHYQRRNYASAYIVFQEALITFVCEKEGTAWHEQGCREAAKQQIKYENIYGLRAIWDKINKIRNAIAHQLRKQGASLQTGIEQLPQLQKEFLKITKVNV